MCSERIYTAQSISEKQPRTTLISSAAQQDPGTGSICIDSHFDSSYSLICLLIHSLIHFIWLPGQQSSSKFAHRSLLDGCFSHPWYKWVRTNFSAVRTVCFISVSLNVNLGWEIFWLKWHLSSGVHFSQIHCFCFSMYMLMFFSALLLLKVAFVNYLNWMWWVKKDYVPRLFP